ncbi:MAG: hypothetical protein AB7L09_03005 [Nitrospira sp.]
MNTVEKALARRLRHLWSKVPAWAPEVLYLDQLFAVGEFAAKLVPYWVESEYQAFEGYLYHRCGVPFADIDRIALLMHTYYEIPSLHIWQQVGWHRVVWAASRDQEGQRQRLIDGGLTVLDLMTMVR